MLVNKGEIRFSRAGRGVQLGLDPKACHPGPVLDPALRASRVSSWPGSPDLTPPASSRPLLAETGEGPGSAWCARAHVCFPLGASLAAVKHTPGGFDFSFSNKNLLRIPGVVVIASGPRGKN